MAEIDLKQELTMLLEREVGFTGKFILEKQCRSLDIDPDRISASDLEPLSKRVIWAIKSYTGEKRAEDIRKSILEYRNAMNVVEGAAESVQQPESLIEAEMTIAGKKIDIGMHFEALGPLKNAKKLLGKTSPDARKALESKICRMMGRALSASAKTIESAFKEYHKSISAGEASGQYYDVALSWNGIASVSWRLGKHKEALESYRKALASLGQMTALSKNDKSRKQVAEAIIKSGFGNVYLDLLDYDSAIKHNEDAIELFKAMDNGAEVGRIYNNLARVYEDMGNYPRAIDRYERAIKYCGESGSQRMQGWAMANLASTLVENNRVDDARPHLEKAERILGEFTDQVAHSKLNCMWGKYHRERGEWSKGIDRFRKSIDAVKDAKAPDYLAIAREEFGILYLKKGDKEKAAEILGQALEWYVEKNDTVKIPKLQKLLSNIKQ